MVNHFKNKNPFKILGENAFLPTCLKLKINFTTESSVECTKFRMSRDQMAVPDRASCSTHISFSHPKVSATGLKFSVLCHVATGSLVSHHGLRKYWHFVSYEIKFYLMHTSKKGKRKGGRGAKKLCFKDNRLKAKEYRALKSSKKNICWLIADLYAL